MWRQLPEEMVRRIAKMQNSALSALIIAVTENTRGPKITKVFKFPLSAHLNAAATPTSTAFSTNDACILLANAESCCRQVLAS